jgi:hypothetical protein
LQNLTINVPAGEVYHIDNRLVYRVSGEPTPEPQSNGLSSGAIVGIGSGSALAAVAVGIICCHYRRKRQQGTSV